MTIPSANENLVRAGLPPRPPSRAPGESMNAARHASAQADSMTTLPGPPAGAAPRSGACAGWRWFGLHEPAPPRARTAATCAFVAIDDLARLKHEVPALREAQPGTYVAFDLDDTLICKGPTGAAQRTQDSTLATLTDLQQRHTCFGLTARPYGSAYDTFFHLESLGIRFSGLPGVAGPYHGMSAAGNLGGVYYAGWRNPKGELLATLRRQHPAMRHLVFVDDQPCSFFSMADAALRQRDDFKLTCVRYSRCSTHPTAEADWHALKDRLQKGGLQSLRPLCAADRKWHRSLADLADGTQRRATHLLWKHLSRTEEAVPQRVRAFLQEICDTKILDPAEVNHLQEMARPMLEGTVN